MDDSSSTPAIPISSESAARAVDSLLKWIRTRKEKQRKAERKEDINDLIHLVLTMKAAPSKPRSSPALVHLPYPLHSFEQTSICLLVDDRPNSPSTAALRKIQAESLPVIRIIGVSTFKSDYKTGKAKLELWESYDVFLADRRIINLLPRLIGKKLFASISKKKRMPLPVDLSHRLWKEQMRRSCEWAPLYLGKGTCCRLVVAKDSMFRDEILDNVSAAIQRAVPRIPYAWGNLRSLHLKSDESIALPIYEES